MHSKTASCSIRQAILWCGPEGKGDYGAMSALVQTRAPASANTLETIVSVLAVLAMTVRDEVHDSCTWAIYVRFSYIRSGLPSTLPVAYTVKPNKVSVMKMMTAQAQISP